MRRLNFIGIFVLQVTALAVAQNAGLYLNFKIDGDGNGFVSQSVEMCDDCSASLQVTEGSVSSELNSILREFWKPTGAATLTFESDIDFREMDESGACVANHEPIVFLAKGGKIDGGRNTFKNICFRQTVDYSQTSGRMSGPIGVFDSLQSVEVFDIRIENLNVAISARKENLSGNAASWFHGVGALTGRAIDSKISGITLKNVRLSSLVAGGVVGNALNTSFSNISSEDRLDISNHIWMDKTHAALKGTTKMGAYASCLGGIVGYGLNVSANDVNLSVELSNTQGDFVGMGGLVGQMLMNNSIYDAENLSYENVKVESSSIKGGSAMGGLFGAVLSYEMGKGFNVNIENSSFEGSISSSVSDSVFVGGLIARTQLITNELSILGSSSNMKLADDRSTKAVYYNAGGFIGGMGSYIRSTSNSDFVSIRNSKAFGNISLTDKNEKEGTAKGYVAAGGAAGVAYIAATDSAFINNTVEVSIDAALNLTEADSLDVGGFFGYVGMREGAEAGLQIRSSEYSGSLNVSGTESKSFVGGAVGEFRKGENGNFIAFEQVKVSAKNSQSLISINGNDETAALNHYGYVGGVCGYCRTPSMNKVAVHGDIDVLGNLEMADSLFVGGYIGYVSTGSPSLDFNILNSYYMGSIHVNIPEKTEHPIYMGYMAGKLTLNNSGAAHTIMSNYHYGDDALDAFGSFLSGNQKVWTASPKSCLGGVSGFCWDVKYNVRNGSKTDVDDNDNGVFANAYMKGELLSVLNTPYRIGFAEEKAWEYDVKGVENDGYPYWIGESVAIEEPESSSSVEEPESSSSAEEPESSSSAEEPESSSSAEKPESSSSVEKPASSSSVEVPVSSSSNAETIIVDIPEVNHEPLVWRAGHWNIISPKGLKAQENSSMKGALMYRWNEQSMAGDFWQYQAYSFRSDVNAESGIWYQGTDDILVLEPTAKLPEDAEVVWNVDSVYSGWNLVANPYGTAIDLSSCDDLKSLKLWRWLDAEGDYDDGDKVLGPYEGAWVKAESQKTIRCAAKPVLKSSKKVLANEENAESNGWTLRAILSDDFGKRDSRNILGSALHEVSEAEPPAGMGSSVRLSIVENKRLLSRSLKQEAEEMNWNVRLSASNARDGYLTLDGVAQVNALGKKVFVTLDGRTTELKDGKSLKVALKSTSKNAVVTVTSKDMSVVANSSKAIRGLRGTYSANVLKVNFELESNLYGQMAQVDLVDVSGSVVATQKQQTVAGLNSLGLNLQKRGLYILRVRVGNQVATRNIAIR